MREEKKIDYMNTTRLIAMSLPKNLLNKLYFSNEFMSLKYSQNAFVQNIMRYFLMYSVGPSTCTFQRILTFIYFSIFSNCFIKSSSICKMTYTVIRITTIEQIIKHSKFEMKACVHLKMRENLGPK